MRLPTWRGLLVAGCGFVAAFALPNLGSATLGRSLSILLGMVAGILIVLAVDCCRGVPISQHFRHPRDWLR
ncbi:MAG: hypothetical protein KJZ69_08200 [Phycisphaerales bacterium]|nr:hypothetical protein [Phycisphaerales bacterium]